MFGKSSHVRWTRVNILRPLWLVYNRLVLSKWNSYKYRDKIKVMITGTKGKTSTTIIVSKIFKQAGYTVGYCSTENTVIEDKVIQKGGAGYSGSKKVFAEPRVNCAVLEIPRGSLGQRGLFVSRCDAAALLNIGQDHIGQQYGIDSQEMMRDLKRKVTDASTGPVVLNADDALTMELALDYGPSRTILFSLDPDVVEKHVSTGGKALTLTKDRSPSIIEVTSSSTTKIIDVAEIPASMNGKVYFLVANVLAAVALARSVGVNVSAVQEVLRELRFDDSGIPGRFQVLEGYPYTVIIDRGTAQDSLKSILEVVSSLVDNEGLTSEHRVRVMLTAPGNRPDDYYENMAKVALNGGANSFVLFESDALRSDRAVGYITERLEMALLAEGLPSKEISVATDPLNAIKQLIESAEPGDVLCFLGNNEKSEIISSVKAELLNAGYDNTVSNFS